MGRFQQLAGGNNPGTGKKISRELEEQVKSMK